MARIMRAVVGLSLTIGLMLSTVVGAGAVQTAIPDSEQPITNTARVLDGYIYGMDRLGDTVVVVGDFTTVRDWAFGSAEQTRVNIFSFDLSTGDISQTFVPQVDDVVHAVDITDDGDQVLIAGEFKTVNGQDQRAIARLDLADGSLDTGFATRASAAIYDMEVSDDEIVVGGIFGFVGGEDRDLLAALDPDTGQAITAFDFDLTGVMNPDQPGQTTRVTEVDISPDGKWLVAVGSFTQVDGADRGQIALFDLDDYSLADWRSPELGEWPCARGNRPTYLMSAEFGPDSSYLVGGTQGAYRGGPDAGVLCDAVFRFELPPVATGDVQPTWANFTGGDSLFRVQATDAAVYAGGHQRWANNPYPMNSNGSRRGDRDGPGSVERYGIGAFDPVSGVPLSWFPNRDAARPVRGFEVIEPVGDLLLLGSDSTRLGGEIRQRVGIYDTAGGPVPPKPEPKVLPATLMTVDDDDVLRGRSFDGTSLGQPSPVSGPGVDGADWDNVDDAFLQNGELTYFGRDAAYYMRDFAPGDVGPDTNLSTTVGYVNDANVTPFDQPYNVDSTRAAAYLDGRIIYTRGGDNDLHWRWYSLESGIINPQEFVVDDGSWSDVAAMTIADDQLFTATTAGELVAYDIQSDHTGVSVDTGSRRVVDTAASWATVNAMFTVVGDDQVAPDTTIDEPATDGEVVGTESTVSGTVSDDREPGGVSVTIGSADGSRWVQSDGSIGSTQQTLSPTLVTTSPTTGSWSIDVSLPDDDWVVTATGFDAAGNSDPTPATRDFTVSTAPPDSTIQSPANRAIVPAGPVTISGSATAAADGVASVGVTVRDRDTLDWLQPDGSFASGFARIDATLDDPGAPSTGWSFDVDLPSGDWAVTTRAVSTTGATEQDTAFSRFETEEAVDDDVDPDTTIDTPAARAVVPAGTVTISGGATDDSSGVAEVLVTVRNRRTLDWLQSDGTFASSFDLVPATVASVGSTSTTWTLDVDVTPDDYAITSRAVDEAGNTEQNRPFSPFTVQ